MIGYHNIQHSKGTAFVQTKQESPLFVCSI
jgi:hypothetical protein